MIREAVHPARAPRRRRPPDDRQPHRRLRPAGAARGARRAGAQPRADQAARLHPGRDGRLLPVARLPAGRRLVRDGGRDLGRAGARPRPLRPRRGRRAAAGAARRHAGPPAERLDVREPERRLRVPALLGDGAARPGARRPWRARPARPDARRADARPARGLTMADAPVDPGPAPAVRGYHAHVYYDAATRERAARLRDELAARFAVRLGRWHDVLVGPHTASMYQVAFEPEELARLLPWLML